MSSIRNNVLRSAVYCKPDHIQSIPNDLNDLIKCRLCCCNNRNNNITNHCLIQCQSCGLKRMYQTTNWVSFVYYLRLYIVIANIPSVWFYVNMNCDFTGARWHNCFRLVFFSTQLFRCSIILFIYACNGGPRLHYSCSKFFLIRSLKLKNTPLSMYAHVSYTFVRSAQSLQSNHRFEYRSNGRIMPGSSK